MFLSMHFLPLCVLALHRCTFCHCTSALFHCFAPLSIAPLHCTAIAIALFHCNYAPFHWNVSFDHCTVSINAHSALASSSIAIAIVALLSRIIIFTNIAIYIHYPNIHYQNVARSIIKPIINTYIYALQSADKSIQAQFSILNARNWVSTLPRSFCTFTISHLSVGHFCKMSEILSFIASLLTERSLPWIKNLVRQTVRNIYDTFLCCDTYCHTLQMINVYERFSLYFNDTSNTFHVSGFPQPQYRWLKDGDYISGFSSEYFYKVLFGIKEIIIFYTWCPQKMSHSHF